MIREMKISDLDFVCKLENELFSSPWKREDFRYQIEDNEFSHDYVLIENDEIVGYIGMWILFEHAQITTLGIDKKHQGKGLSKQLMNHAIQRAGEFGCEDIALEVRISNSIAINLYKKYGFIQINIRKSYYVNPIEDAYLMMKPLGGTL